MDFGSNSPAIDSSDKQLMVVILLLLSNGILLVSLVLKCNNFNFGSKAVHAGLLKSDLGSKKYDWSAFARSVENFQVSRMEMRDDVVGNTGTISFVAANGQRGWVEETMLYGDSLIAFVTGYGVQVVDKRRVNNPKARFCAIS